MKRFHVHAHVQDLHASIGFYSRLFGAEPARVESDYAKWMLDDPRVNFAISTRGGAVGVDHLGIQADSPEELVELKARAAALSPREQGEVSCCYARSDKHWITDPQGASPGSSFRPWPTSRSSASRPAARRCSPTTPAARRCREKKAPAAEHDDPGARAVHAQLGAQRACRGHAQPLGGAARAGRARAQRRQRAERAREPARAGGAVERRRRDRRPVQQVLGSVQRRHRAARQHAGHRGGPVCADRIAGARQAVRTSTRRYRSCWPGAGCCPVRCGCLT